jgi:hypothetical protein
MGRKIGGGHESGSLYYLDIRDSFSSVALQSFTSHFQYHCHLSHPSLQVLKLLVSSCCQVESL